MKKLITVVVVFVALLILLPNALYEVKENQYAVVKRLGKIETIIDEPGLNAKIPFVQSVEKYTKALIVYDIPESDVLSLDKKTMIADCYVLWRIKDPAAYIRTLGGVALRAEERIDAATYNAVKNTISAMTQEEVIASRGESLTTKITQKANAEIGEYGIEIVTAQIKTLSIPKDNQTAVYERMMSERQNIAAGYEAAGKAEAQKIKNETDKEVAVMLAEAKKEAAVLEAEGEEEYMKILQNAYNNPSKAEFYQYIRGLDSLKESLLNSSDTTLILDKDSELVKILYGE
jgi:membrane protease subunit HflC